MYYIATHANQISTSQCFRHRDFMPRQKDTNLKNKMSRSETVSLRLDPRLNYLCDLGARSQRRTKSSFIEVAIAEKIERLQNCNWRDMNEEQTLGERGDYLWSIHEQDRLVSLGLAAPHLMTFEEQELWSVIHKADCFWSLREDYGSSHKRARTETSIKRQLIEQHWDLIVSIAKGEAQKENLPEPQPLPPLSFSGFGAKSTPPDLDDDVPF
jgi:hypothetical protein